MLWAFCNFVISVIIQDVCDFPDFGVCVCVFVFCDCVFFFFCFVSSLILMFL